MALLASETILLLTIQSQGSVLIWACATALWYIAVVLTPNNVCKNLLLNQKCFQFFLRKEDFEHSDPFPRVLGPIRPDYKLVYCVSTYVPRAC